MGKKKTVTAKVVFREKSILCGKPWIDCFPNLFKTLKLKWNYQEGDIVKKNSTVVVIKGLQKEILMAERVMINYLQTMSGIATKTESYVKKQKNLTLKFLTPEKLFPCSDMNQNMRYMSEVVLITAWDYMMEYLLKRII